MKKKVEIKKRLFPYVSERVYKDLKQYCSRYDISESAAIEGAIEDLLNKTHQRNLVGRIAVIEDLVETISKQTAIMTEMISIVLQESTSGLDEIDLDQIKAQSMLMQEKMQRIEEQVVDSITSKMSFVDRVQEQLFEHENA